MYCNLYSRDLGARLPFIARCILLGAARRPFSARQIPGVSGVSWLDRSGLLQYSSGIKPRDRFISDDIHAWSLFLGAVNRAGRVHNLGEPLLDPCLFSPGLLQVHQVLSMRRTRSRRRISS